MIHGDRFLLATNRFRIHYVLPLLPRRINFSSFQVTSGFAFGIYSRGPIFSNFLEMIIEFIPRKQHVLCEGVRILSDVGFLVNLQLPNTDPSLESNPRSTQMVGLMALEFLFTCYVVFTKVTYCSLW